MTDQVNRDGPPSTVELLLDFLDENLTRIIAGLVLLIATVGVFLSGFSVPRRAKLVAITMLLLAPIGKLVGDYIVGLLWDPNYIYLVDLDARVVDGALYQFPFDHFRELDVTEGQLTELTPNLYVGRQVDIEEMTAVGTWRGTLDDTELLTALQAVRECRGQLQDQAQRGWVLDTHGWSIIWRAVRDEIASVVRSFEEGTLPDEGLALHEAIDDALEQYDLDNELAEITDDLDVEPADADGDLDLDDVDDLDDLEDPTANGDGQEIPADD